MARLVTVSLHRTDDSIPWGFRIQGGADYDAPLTVQRVTPGSLASPYLNPGDLLLTIEGQDARLMCHFDASELVKMAGNNVELIVRKADSQHLCAENIAQQEKLEQQVIEKRVILQQERQFRRAMREVKSPINSSDSPTPCYSSHSTPVKCSSPPETKMTSPIAFRGHVERSQQDTLPMSPKILPKSSSAQHRHALSDSPPVMHKDEKISKLDSSVQKLENIPISPPEEFATPTFQTSGARFSFSPLAFPKSPPVTSPMSPHMFQYPATGLPPTSKYLTSPQTIALSPPIQSTAAIQITSDAMQRQLYSSSSKTHHEVASVSTQQEHHQTNFTKSIKESLQKFARKHLESSSTTITQQSSLSSTSAEKHEALSKTSSFSHQRVEEMRHYASVSQHLPFPTPIENTYRRIQSPPANISPSSYRRTSCSPQKVIPPLPKTIFPFNKSDPIQRAAQVMSPNNKCMSPISLESPLYSQAPIGPTYFLPTNQCSPKPYIKQEPVPSPLINNSNSPAYSTSKQMFSPSLPFQSSSEQNTSPIREISPKKLEAIDDDNKTEGCALDKEPAVEDVKQRQLQILIEEKVRLEELMMVAKRRQSISEDRQSQILRSTGESKSPVIRHGCQRSQSAVQAAYTLDVSSEITQPNSNETTSNLKLSKQIDNKSTENICMTSSETVIHKRFSSSCSSLIENLQPSFRQEEEQDKLRKDNQIRDEKIRRMQERRYEEKIKKEILRTAREKSCPLIATKQKDLLNSDASLANKDGISDTEKDPKKIYSNNIRKNKTEGKLATQKNNSCNAEKMAKTDQKFIEKSKIAPIPPFRGTKTKNDSKKTVLKEKVLDQHDKNAKQSKEKNSLLEQFKLDQQKFNAELDRIEQMKHFPDSLEKLGKRRQDNEEFIVISRQQEMNMQIEISKQLELVKQLKLAKKKKQEKLIEEVRQEQLANERELECKQQEISKQQVKTGEINWNKQQKETKKHQEESKKKLEETKKHQEESKKKLDEIKKEQEKTRKQQEETRKQQEEIRMLQEETEKINAKQIREVTRKEKSSKKKPLQRQEELIRLQDLANQTEVIDEKVPKSDPDKNLLRPEERLILERILIEEENKLLEQKRKLEEKKKKKEVQEKYESRARLKHMKKKASTKPNRATALSAPPTGKCQTYVFQDADNSILYELQMLEEQQRLMNQQQRQEIYESDTELHENLTQEAKLVELRRVEEERMRREEQIYDEYQLHLEAKRKNQMYDSDDYASEWETGEEEMEDEAKLGVHLEEKFDELKATSEEELFEAQEKSIRNLERQLRKQKQREIKKSIERKHRAEKEGKGKIRSYSSTGDLQTKTRPITKFSPDPMEFGFRPIENPQSNISKSTGCLSFGPSASSIAHVAGAEAGIAAGKRPMTKKFDFNRRASEDLGRAAEWDNSFRMSTSLEDLQQVSRKPPLPSQAKTKVLKLRNAASEETLNKPNRIMDKDKTTYSSELRRTLPCEDPRRHTYAEGEEFSESHLDLGDLEEEEYNKLLNEYYAAYYDTYYHSFYRRQQKDIAEIKMNYGPPPPPPPPPFATGAPPVRLPSEIAAAAAAARLPAPPMMGAVNLPAPPMALAGAMMKDKKPFTYTPGGLNLSEIKSPRMQRRLQRNANSEGVPISPLAQPQRSTPQTSAGSSPIIPHHGMIQVLPMPGMAMAKPQNKESSKEPPKPKRNVCGPAPPPPPFAISSGSSIEPSETPYTTPNTTPAINSFSPPSTPGTSSSPSVPAVNTAPLFNGLQEDFNVPNDSQEQLPTLLPMMATEPGPSATSVPPPPPPPAGGHHHKIPLSPTVTPPFIPALSKNVVNINPTPASSLTAANLLKARQPSSTPDLGQDSTSDLTESSSPMSHDEQRSSSQKIESSSREYETSLSESEIERLVGDESSSEASKPSQNILKNIEEAVQKTKDSLEEDTLFLNPTEDIKNEDNKTYICKTQEFNKPSDKVDTFKTVPTKNVAPSSAPELNVKDNVSQKHLNNTQGSSIVESQNVILSPTEEDEPKEVPISKPNYSNIKSVQAVPNSNASNSNSCEIAQNPTVSHTDFRKQNPNHPIVRSAQLSNNPESPIFRPDFISASPEHPTKSQMEPSKFKPAPFIVKPIARMASPPPAGPKPSPVVINSRMMRQASLPAQAPPSPPTKAEETTSPTMRNFSPNSGLSKAPMPWMCGVKKETSPVPEFLTLSRKNHQRIQRQRSLPQTQEPKGKVPTPQGFRPVISSPSTVPIYSPPIAQVTITSPVQVYQNNRQQQHLVSTTQPFVSCNQKAQFSQPQKAPSSSQSRFMQQQMVNRSVSLQYQTKPRERIIPIMLEDNESEANSLNLSSPPTNSFSHPISYGQQPSWSQSNGEPMSSQNGGVPFNQFDNQIQSSSTALEALQQMQQNLAQLNTGLQTAQHQPTLSYQVQRGNGNIDPVMQSKSFRVLQNAYDNNYHAEGPIQEQTPVEPKKYTGASIPSRSFRMLQAMTDTEDVLQSPEDGKPGEKSSEKTTALSSSNTPLCSSPSELQEETGNVASYTCTKDSPVYRHVTPKLANNGVKEDRVVNAALSSRRANSPRLWKNIAQASSRNISPSSSSTSISSQTGAESPRLTVPIVKRNDSSESLDSHLLYDGSKIPSRVFKQLQNDYSNEPQAHKSGSSSPTTSRIITEVHLPRIFNQMNIEPPTSSNDDDARSFSSSSNFDYEDACRNGVYETAAVKESVLKELTSQFDPQTKLKKPRAAPGRVFRYLQEQYGEDIDVKSSLSGRSTGNNSPNILSSTSTDSGHYEMEPKPYDGGRIPGRTFRMLQENYESHPSVLQARK